MTPTDKQIRDADMTPTKEQMINEFKPDDIQKAKAVLKDLCSNRGQYFRMSIPVDRDDSDMVLSRVIKFAEKAVLQAALDKGSDERRFTQFIKEPGKPMKMLITNNWLKNRIENDPDLECGAGPAFITPDQQNPAPEDLLFRLEYWGNFEYKDGCEYAHQILLDYRDVIVKALTQPQNTGDGG